MNFFLFFLDLINSYIQNYYYLSLFIFFLFLLIYFSFSLPGGPIILLASGFFFGFLIGFIINIVSIVLGSLIFFIVSKFLFKNLLKNYYEIYSLKLTNIIKKSSYEYLILLRLIVGAPLFIQNLCLSILNISKVKFIISSSIGLSPFMVLFSYLGNQLSDLIQVKKFNLIEVFTFELLIIFLILISVILLRIFYKNK
mgnify:FL=1